MRAKRTFKPIWVIAGVWALMLGGFFLYKSWTIQTGTEVLLKVRMYDPRDLFRGDYAQLNYEISRFKPRQSSRVGESRFLVLEEKGGVTKGVVLNQSRPRDGSLYIKGVIKERGRRKYMEYGIENYFFPEGEWRSISSLLRSGAAAKVIIDKAGRAVLRDLVPFE